MKEILDDKVEKVIVSYRIVDSPCFITKSEYRLVCQHEAHHVSAGAERQLDGFLHDVQEDDGGQSHALHYDVIEQEGVGRQTDKTVKDLI